MDIAHLVSFCIPNPKWFCGIFDQSLTIFNFHQKIKSYNFKKKKLKNQPEKKFFLTFLFQYLQVGLLKVDLLTFNINQITVFKF